MAISVVYSIFPQVGFRWSDFGGFEGSALESQEFTRNLTQSQRCKYNDNNSKTPTELKLSPLYKC